MFKTIVGLAVAGFVFKRSCPDAYKKSVQALSDVVDSVSDITTATRGQIKAYASEAAKDAQQRLSKADPEAIKKLRDMLK